MINMFSVLKSDFYKLFCRKAFYICGLISGLVGVLLVVLINNEFPYAKELGYNGINSTYIGLGQVTLLATIFLSMFVSSEFSYGTIKNMCSRGISRAGIYLSKIIIGIFTSITYILFTAFCGFVSGSLMWGVGELKSEDFWSILRLFGLFILAEACLQSIFIMIGFLIRHSGGTVSANLGIYVTANILIFPILDYGIKSLKWFELKESTSQYWVGSYVQTFMSSLELDQAVINRGIIVCLVYFVISLIIGITTFYRRDVR